jgi:hypothetical protein
VIRGKHTQRLCCAVQCMCVDFVLDWHSEHKCAAQHSRSVYFILMICLETFMLRCDMGILV